MGVRFATFKEIMSKKLNLQSPKDTFKASGQSAGEFLTQTGVYFYIPTYQRDFAWKPNDDLKRLFVDVSEGVFELAQENPIDSLMFIGALILVEDRDKEQIHPIVRDEVPAKVNIIIDGQQRCTAMLVWSCVLLDQIQSQIRVLNKDDKLDTGYKKAIKLANVVCKSLELIIHDDERGAQPEFAYYPRMIRSHDDQWSTDKNTAKYVSPIAKLLRDASEWIRGGFKTSLKYSIDDVSPEDRSRYEPINAAFKYFKKRCAAFLEGEEYETVAPPLPAQMAGNSNFQSCLWSNPWAVEMQNVVRAKGKATERSYNALIGLVRLMSLANFMMNRICFTVVHSDRENCAFDMFDALNTTGQPLTAFETFRPTVIEQVGLANYRQSEEFRKINIIDGYLRDSLDKKGKRTEKLIIHARLYELGEKLSKRLAMQRAWLKAYYQELTCENSRLNFLGGLASLAEFTDIFENSEQHIQLCGDQATLLALEQLSKVKHDIVIPILTKFHSAIACSNNNEAVENAKIQLRLVIRATVAFSTLWRLARGGTDKIDDCFRNIMKGGELKNGSKVGPFCTQPGKTVGSVRSVNASEYIKDLNLYCAESGWDNEDNWVEETKNRGVYSENVQLTKFFLAAAMHDSIPDPKNVQLLKKGNKGSCDMLSWSAPWNKFQFDIEHIAPQSEGSPEWPNEIYAGSGDLPDSFGNLTLLPLGVNRAIKNWNWTKKRSVLELLTCLDNDEAEQKRLKLIDDKELPEFPTLQKIIEDASYHAHLRSVIAFEFWNKSAIQTRGDNICRLGYQQLRRWINADSKINTV